MTKRRMLVVSCVVMIGVASVALGQIPAGAFVVPVVVKSPGAGGSFWSTDLYLSNLGTQSTTVSAHFFRENTANTFNGTFAKSGVVIKPGETLKVTDVVGTWFPSAGSSTKGWLFVANTTPVDCRQENRVPAKLAISTRVYNTPTPGSTFGQIVESAWGTMNGSKFPSVFTGIRNTGTSKPGFRTNVGIANLSTVAITVNMKLFRGNGVQAGGTISRSVPALSLSQWELTSLGFPALTDATGKLEVTLVNPTYDPCSDGQTAPACLDRCEDGCGGRYGFNGPKMFVAYASNVDNTTGDGENLLPVIDWQAFNDWSSAYRDANCPDDDDIERLSRAARRLGFEIRRDTTFRVLD